jgi:AraC-like DNA-binding protein
MSKLNKVSDAERIQIYHHIAEFQTAAGIHNPVLNDLFHIVATRNIGDGFQYALSAFRNNFYEIDVILEEKDFSFQIGSRRYTTQSSYLCFVRPMELQSYKMTPDSICRGYMIYFKKEFLFLEQYHHDFETAFPFFQLNTESVYRPQEMRVFESLAENILAEYKQFQSGSLEIIRAYLNILLHHAKRVCRVEQTAPTRPSEIADHFLLLLSRNASNDFSVEKAAESLQISPKHLSKVLKQTLGKTASEIIHEKLVEEAKHYLVQTALSVSEIAYTLDFDDVSNFAKFFKRYTSLTPAQFRDAAK